MCYIVELKYCWSSRQISAVQNSVTTHVKGQLNYDNLVFHLIWHNKLKICGMCWSDQNKPYKDILLTPSANLFFLNSKTIHLNCLLHQELKGFEWFFWHDLFELTWNVNNADAFRTAIWLNFSPHYLDYKSV